MQNSPATVIPRVLAIQSAALRISTNGHGTTREWLDELMGAVQSGAIQIHEYLNGQTVPWIVSTVKSVDVRKYLVEQYGADLLSVKSGDDSSSGGAAGTEEAPGERPLGADDYRSKRGQAEPLAQPAATAELSEGTATLWTGERKAEAKEMLGMLKSQGVRDFAAKTAAKFGVTPTRLRQVLRDKPQEAAPKKPTKSWPGL